MSEPKVYGFCPAGCRYEVVKMDDFQNNLTVRIPVDSSGTTQLEIGKKYKIYSGSQTLSGVDFWNATMIIDVVGTKKEFGAGYYDKYRGYFYFQLLSVVLTQNYEYEAVYEINGERKTLTFTVTFVGEAKIYVKGAQKIYVVNEGGSDVEVIGVGISDISKTGTSGLVDTYTITLDNGETYNFTVTNGSSGSATDIDSIMDRLDALEYVPIAINSLVNDVNTVELGSTVSSIKFTWSLNKTPTTLTLGGITMENTATTYTMTGLSVKTSKSYTLVAKDEKGMATKGTDVTFVNGVYYGVATEGTVNSAFILNLTKSLQSNKAKTFTVTAGSGQYIWYAVPTRYGTCSFNVGGFDGGFTLKSTVSFTNASGYTENYYVYRSDNANLGAQTVKVS